LNHFISSQSILLFESFHFFSIDSLNHFISSQSILLFESFHFFSTDSGCLARRRLYSSFDGLVERMDIFKVETIGDAYMATTNVVKDQSDHAERLIRLSSSTPPLCWRPAHLCCCLTHSLTPSLRLLPDTSSRRTNSHHLFPLCVHFETPKI
jgi:hypothetical protein